MSPIDVDTQRARTQGNFQRNKQLADDFTKSGEAYDPGRRRRSLASDHGAEK